MARNVCQDNHIQASRFGLEDKDRRGYDRRDDVESENSIKSILCAFVSERLF